MIQRERQKQQLQNKQLFNKFNNNNNNVHQSINTPIKNNDIQLQIIDQNKQSQIKQILLPNNNSNKSFNNNNTKPRKSSQLYSKLSEHNRSSILINKKINDPFQYLKKNSTNLFNQNFYTDDSFKLKQIKLNDKINNKIGIIRLKDVLEINSPLFGQELKYGLEEQNKGNNRNMNNRVNQQQDFMKSLNNIKNLPHSPNFIAQLHMLPVWHYQSLIQPKFINQKGFYHVVIWKDGRLIKQTIDDVFYYNQTFKEIYHQYPFNIKYIWIHILLKVWAKFKGGYSQIKKAQPFQFLRIFSFPDWYILNPALQDLQKLITQINPILKKQYLAIAKTKHDPNVGMFGLIPNSASYLIIGHQMQYQAIFIKIKSLTGTKWNQHKLYSQSTMPQQQIKLQENEFIIPIKQFLNLFHLIYITSNKYNNKQRQDIFYNRYSLNLDARQSKAKLICFQVSGPEYLNPLILQKQKQNQEYMTNITIYFPFVRPYQLARTKQLQNLNIGQYNQNNNKFISNKSINIKQGNVSMNNQLIIPYCKLMLGLQSQTSNLQASFVESMKQKMLQNDQTDFLCIKSNIQYQWKQGTYFKGYDNSCTFLTKLKPGKYFLRFKIQTLRVQYRANINIVSSTSVKIFDPKMDKKQHSQFLKQIINSKARIQKRNIGYFNPIKKGSWYICNDDFQSIGYGYIVIQTRKNSDFRIEIKIDPIKLKENGYRLKAKKEQNKYSIMLEDGEGETFVLKYQQNQSNQKKQKIWPPPGIQILRHWRKTLQKQK